MKQSVEQLPGRAGAAPAQPAAHREDPAAALVASVHRDPWGSVRPSLYETARVLSLAPWLDGADTRLAFVLDRQAADGSWGEGPVRYRLLPTLSAVEALLAQVRRAPAAAPAARPAAAAANGLAALRALPSTGPWPDTAAAEILVPALLARVHRHLDELAGDTDAPTVLGPWIRGERPAPPPAYRMEFPAAVADRIRAAHLPWKLHHTYEGVADHLGGRDLPGTEHLLGSSPAAAAAAASTGGAAERERTAARLAPIAARYGGLFPEAAPITVFERLWVGAALARAGLLADRERALVRGWADRIHDPAGVRGAPGLMADADDTSMALVTGLLTGANRDPAPLEAFARDGHYDCYPGEDTGSVTANAHAAQALALHLRRAPGGDPAAADRLRQVRGWLIERQEPQGHWPDKWHASPYYATARCVTALAGADQPGAAEAVARAADWAAGTRHADGSWGAWGGTAEETAYGVQILLGADPAGCDRDLLARSGTLLRQAADDPGHRHPALWHDKTLYAPLAMVRAEILAALAALGRHTGSADADGPAGPAGAAQ